jgi:tetratricopeptide (TPR) repeat protein
MRKITVSLIGGSLFVAALAFGQVAEGDQHWAQRAEGQVAGHAKPAHIDAAIAAYQNAVAANPNDLEARWKLLRSYRFKGKYVPMSADENKKIYDTAKKAGEDALAVVGRALAAKGVASITKAPEKQVADAARTVPGAPEVFLWDSINWGEWALAYGKMAAAREGAADRIRREATIAELVDPKMEDGTPSRVLGRLHDETPHIPFILSWPSSKEAVRFLNESYKIDPTNKITRVFLAEAMVDNNSDTKPEAIKLLRETIAAPNGQTYEVEQAAANEDAKALLKKYSS